MPAVAALSEGTFWAESNEGGEGRREGAKAETGLVGNPVEMIAAADSSLLMARAVRAKLKNGTKPFRCVPVSFQNNMSTIV